MAIRRTGLEVFEEQVAFHIPQLQLTGHIDAKVRDPLMGELGEVFALEIKSMSPHVWERVKTLKDFDQFSWTAKYPWQLQCYLTTSGFERGVFILKNKSTGELREIWMQSDPELWARIVAKSGEVNRHVEAGTRPEIGVPPGYCQGCEYGHLCRPELTEHGVLAIENDHSLNERIRQWAALKEEAEKYSRLDSEIKEVIGATQKGSARTRQSGLWASGR